MFLHSLYCTSYSPLFLFVVYEMVLPIGVTVDDTVNFRLSSDDHRWIRRIMVFYKVRLFLNVGLHFMLNPDFEKSNKKGTNVWRPLLGLPNTERHEVT